MSAVTVEMKTSFFRPALGELLARGRVLHRSTTMAYCEAELLDTKGHLVAKSLGTFKFLRRKDAPSFTKRK
jgi:acyl-coenzyme A thioesterase PaaI-like protein